MNYRLQMRRKHANATLLETAISKMDTIAVRQARIDHVKRVIEHTISIIAICRIGGQSGAETAYEAQLTRLNKELADLQEQEHAK